MPVTSRHVTLSQSKSLDMLRKSCFSLVRSYATMPSRGLLVVISKPVKDNTAADDFVFEVKEAHKTRRIFLEGGGVKALSHEHYLLKGDSNPARKCMDLYELDDVDPLLDGKILLEEGGDEAGPVRESHTYVYKTSRYAALCVTLLKMLNLIPAFMGRLPAHHRKIHRVSSSFLRWTRQ